VRLFNLDHGIYYRNTRSAHAIFDVVYVNVIIEFFTGIFDSHGKSRRRRSLIPAIHFSDASCDRSRLRNNGSCGAFLQLDIDTVLSMYRVRYSYTFLTNHKKVFTSNKMQTLTNI
jgi:hypothetical protein